MASPLSNSMLAAFLVWMLFCSSSTTTNLRQIGTMACNLQEAQALLHLKAGLHKTKSSVWTTWSAQNANCCEWERVHCDDYTGDVIGLDLGRLGIYGSIPESLNNASLANMYYLYLDHNNITSLPSSIHNLRGLQWLTLDHNPIRNPQNIASIVSAPKLAQVVLNHCNLSGSLPSWLQSFPNSDFNLISDEVTPMLDLAFNAFSGTIPANLGDVLPDYLAALWLENNRLSGKIPSSLSKLQSLRLFNVSNNKLTGQIPQVTPLTSFDASAYTGNPGLCGNPLPACKP